VALDCSDDDSLMLVVTLDDGDDDSLMVCDYWIMTILVTLDRVLSS